MPWFCINTKPKQEFVAKINCENQGFETFLPTYMHQLPKKGEVLRPLFTSYLFVQFDPDNDPWYPLCHTLGVKRLFSYNVSSNKNYAYLRPIPVPDELINTLQQQVIQPATKTKPPIINPGLIVKITSGHLQGRQGICSWSNEKRVTLLMDILNGKVEVTFSRDQVEII